MFEKLKQGKNKIITNTETKRTFSYQKNGVNLSFTLDINNKQQLNDFIDLLANSRVDVLKVVDNLENEENKL